MPTERSKLSYPEIGDAAAARAALRNAGVEPWADHSFAQVRDHWIQLERVCSENLPPALAQLEQLLAAVRELRRDPAETAHLLAQTDGWPPECVEALRLNIAAGLVETQPTMSDEEFGAKVVLARTSKQWTADLSNELRARLTASWFRWSGTLGGFTKQHGMHLEDFRPRRRGRRRVVGWRVRVATQLLRITRLRGLPDLTQRQFAQLEAAAGDVVVGGTAVSRVRSWETARGQALAELAQDERVDSFTVRDCHGEEWGLRFSSLDALLVATRAATETRDILKLAELARPFGPEGRRAVETRWVELGMPGGIRRRSDSDREPKEVGGG